MDKLLKYSFQYIRFLDVFDEDGDPITYFNDKSNDAYQAQINRDFQRDERLAVQEHDLDMWNMNNEYNSIGSQLQRARDAGVNVNTLLSKGNTPFQSSPVTSTPSSGTTTPSSRENVLPTLLDVSNSLAGMAKVISDIRNTDESTRSIRQQNDFFSETKDDQKEIISLNVKSLQTSISRDLADVGIKDVTRRQLEQALSWAEKNSEVEFDTKMQALNNLRIENYNLLEQNKNLQKQGDLLDEQVRGAELANDIVDATKYATLQKSSAEADSAVYKADMDLLQKKFSSVTGIPLGTSEFMINFALWKEGKLEGYLRDVITPLEQSKWKPIDWRAPAGTYGTSFDPRKGIFTPVWRSSIEENFLKTVGEVIPG